MSPFEAARAELRSHGGVRGVWMRGCLDAADAGTFLAAHGDLVVTAPTGAKVTDIVLAPKPGQPSGGV